MGQCPTPSLAPPSQQHRSADAHSPGEIPRPRIRLVLLRSMRIAFSNVNCSQVLRNCLVGTPAARCGDAARDACQACQPRQDQERLPEAVRPNALVRVPMCCRRSVIQPASEPCGQQVTPSGRCKLHNQQQAAKVSALPGTAACPYQLLLPPQQGHLVRTGMQALCWEAHLQCCVVGSKMLEPKQIAAETDRTGGVSAAHSCLQGPPATHAQQWT